MTLTNTTPPVTFVFSDWIAMFPEFSGLSSGQGTAYFMFASLICANSATNPANADGNLTTLLYLLTAHFAWLQAPRDANGNPAQAGQAASQVVGRISSATEGSVTVQTEWKGGDASALENFLIQTKYGAAFWAATAQYRTARYLARPTIVARGFFPRMGGFGWWNG